jgi:Xaa-Pro aminopeptidase
MTRNSWDGRTSREVAFVRHLEDAFPQVKVKDCSELIWELRLVKSPAEVEIMRRAARLRVKALLETMKSTRPGMWEYEVAASSASSTRRRAGSVSSRCGSGSSMNSSIQRITGCSRTTTSSSSTAGPGGLLSWIFPPIRPTEILPRQKYMKPALPSMPVVSKPAWPWKSGASGVAQKKDMTFQDVFKAPLFRQLSTVGLDGHDAGGADLDYCGPLKPGLVFASDVFAVYPGEKLGVRVENTVLITENGCENLTVFPREISELESLMKDKGIIQLLKEAKRY